MNTYEQFIHITQVDNSAVKSIFMHLNNVVSKINQLKFNRIVLSLKNNSDYTLIYELEQGKKIPIAVFNSLALLFTNPSFLTDDIIINVQVTYEDKIYNINYEDNKLQCPPILHFLFAENKYFNFFTNIHTTTNNLELFEKLFEFLIKKELSTEAESVFQVQFDKYFSGSQEENAVENETKLVNTEILIERLLKTKNDIFSRINVLTKNSSNLAQEKEKLIDYAQNKEKYILKYEGLKQDYILLTEQSKTFFKNVKDLEKVIEQISHELENVQLHVEKSNLPEAERIKIKEERDFLIEKKTSFTNALVEAEANLSNMSGLISSTKSSMEVLYADMDLINHTTLEDTSMYDKEVGVMKRELENLYLQSSNIDIELNKLQKESSTYSISREYAELSTKGTDDITVNALRTSLHTQIIPQSINTVYKYLLNLFLYHCTKQNNQGILDVKVLKELSIFPQTFFTKYSKDEVLIG